jgi:hypothetical protein
MSRRPVIPVLWLATVIFARGYTQERTGDPAAAEKYVQWALGAAGEGRWREAEAALERAADYADVSSDLSYLLALARSHEGRPGGAVLEAARRALETDRWRRYTPEEGRLLEAETLIRLRSFPMALESLSRVPESAAAARLRLLALRGLPDMPAFRAAMARALEQYPREPALVRILLETLRPGYGTPLYPALPPQGLPPGNEGELVALALRRLPFLLESDPELAYRAVPFVRDTAEARRLVESYRAAGGRKAASLPAALALGVIDEDQAMDELFYHPALVSPARPAEPVLDRALLGSLYTLLRSDGGKDRFIRNLLSFSGVITEDAQEDGYIEARTRYRDGMITGYSRDADQDGLPETELFFTGGVPDRAEFVVLPDASVYGQPEAFRFPVKDEERSKAFLWWERYPAVLRTELAGLVYIPRPLELNYAPVRLAPLFGSGPLYPEGEQAGLTRRALVSFSLAIERPGYGGGLERVELDRGVPRRAVETLDGRTVSVTEFRLGRPYTQRIDLDLDGRMETVRRFRRDFESPVPAADHPWEYAGILEFSESDWDGDGVFEYGETYLPGNTVIRSWDMDRDGVREYVETSVGAGNDEVKQN